jgi:hypothetical protein
VSGSDSSSPGVEGGSRASRPTQAATGPIDDPVAGGDACRSDTAVWRARTSRSPEDHGPVVLAGFGARTVRDRWRAVFQIVTPGSHQVNGGGWRRRPAQGRCRTFDDQKKGTVAPPHRSTPESWRGRIGIAASLNRAPGEVNSAHGRGMRCYLCNGSLPRPEPRFEWGSHGDSPSEVLVPKS